MNKKILITSVAALFAGAVSTASLAESYQTDSALDISDTGAATAGAVTDSFTAIDVNGDGMISVEEAQASSTLNDGFARTDANSDGHLDATEFSAFEATTGTAAQ